MNTQRQRDAALTLQILDAIGEQEGLTQRRLAVQLGVALGLANSYLKRCIRKGLIKVSQAPANRYLYYLTAQGFAEKSRLTAEYLNYSFSFYRKAGESCGRVFRLCEQRGWRRLLLYGLSDLAEIASVRVNEYASLDIVGFCDSRREGHQFLTRPVWRKPCEAVSYDACVLTDLQNPQLSYARLQRDLDRERILVPDVLGLNLNTLEEQRKYAERGPV